MGRELLVGNHFRGSVGRSACQWEAGLIQLPLEDGRSEVQELGIALSIHSHVLWLHVAMDDASAVQVLQPTAQLVDPQPQSVPVAAHDPPIQSTPSQPLRLQTEELLRFSVFTAVAHHRGVLGEPKEHGLLEAGDDLMLGGEWGLSVGEGVPF